MSMESMGCPWLWLQRRLSALSVMANVQGKSVPSRIFVLALLTISVQYLARNRTGRAEAAYTRCCRRDSSGEQSSRTPLARRPGLDDKCARP